MASPRVKQALMSAAGAAGGAGLDIDTVFKIHTFQGTGQQNEQNTGIDMATEGGLVWIKRHDNNGSAHNWFDTERGSTKRLATNLTSRELTSTSSQDFKSFDNDGFTLNATGYNAHINNSSTYPNTQYTSYNFRKCANFFDIVTFSGDGSTSRAISHSLGVTPAWIVIKRRDDTGDWWVYHRKLNGGTNPHTRKIALNEEQPEETYFNNEFGNTAPTSTNFYVGGSLTNNSSGTYVAYLWAHHANDGSDTGFGPDGTTPVISCGGWTGDNNQFGPTISCGFQPQFLLTKNIDDNYNTWYVFDRMRGFGGAGMEDAFIRPNETNATDVGAHYISVNPDGFQVHGSGGHMNANNSNFIYVAISAGGFFDPTDIDDIFDSVKYTTDYTDDRELNTSNRVDFFMGRAYEYTVDFAHIVSSRLINNGAHYLRTNSNGQASDNSDGLQSLVLNKGFRVGDDNNIKLNYQYQLAIANSWTRSKGFFDERPYFGNGGTSQTFTHGLQSEPKMMIVKCVNGAGDWVVYHSGIGNQKRLLINSTDGESSSSDYWNNTSPTSTHFTIGSHSTVNSTNFGYHCFLFGEIDGMTKFGSYTGNGSTGQSITTGFQPQWLLIKRSDSSSTNNWVVLDAARGVTSSDDSVLYLSANDAAADAEYVDFNSNNFQFKNGNSDVNGSGMTYIYYAISA